MSDYYDQTPEQRRQLRAQRNRRRQAGQIYRIQSDAGMLPFHLQEHLLCRGMLLLQLRYGGQYLLCVFWHTANPPNARMSLIILLLLYLYFFLCQQPQKACAPKAARSTLTVLTVSVIITV